MADRIQVSGPVPSEELRQLAEAIADLHYVVGMIVDHATDLVPGEAVDELIEAWKKSRNSMEILIRNLDPSPPSPPGELPRVPISYQTLVEGELSGEVGKLKRSILGRLKDRFLMFWNSEPRTDEKRMKAAEAAGDYTEFGATVASSIPGSEKVVEFLSLTKQLIGIRAKRGM